VLPYMCSVLPEEACHDDVVTHAFSTHGRSMPMASGLPGWHVACITHRKGHIRGVAFDSDAMLMRQRLT
jgi:hypothetical protein